jgi:hypothetical protein
MRYLRIITTIVRRPDKRANYMRKLIRILLQNRLIRRIYLSCRFLMPSEPVLYAGAKSPYKRCVFDQHLPHTVTWQMDHTSYEAALVHGIRSNACRGDRCVIIGGGIGVTSAIASDMVGESGRVLCFEGSLDEIDKIMITLKLNLASNVEVIHGTVGERVHVYGESSRFGRFIDPSELPDCDILEMDCEGSELGILGKMTIRPRVVLVETHGHHGSSSSAVSRQLSFMGYTVDDLGVAEPLSSEFCDQNDIRVLVARR